jgi:hypothetical protein
MEISFFLRKPKFPIICNIDGYVVAAKSIRQFGNELSKLKFPADTPFPVIDIAGEGWAFYPEFKAISPLTTKKRWIKKEVIVIFNNRKNNSSNILYSEKSLSAKRFDRIFQDIVELLIKSP